MGHNRKFFLCSNSIKDEFHFILICPVYVVYHKNILSLVIRKKHPSMSKLLQLCNAENVKKLCYSGKFFYFILKTKQNLPMKNKMLISNVYFCNIILLTYMYMYIIIHSFLYWWSAVKLKIDKDQKWILIRDHKTMSAQDQISH